MENLVTVTIDNRQAQVPADMTIIKAAETIGIKVPSLCYQKELTPTGGCGICLVDVQGARDLVRACTTPVADGMVVRTHNRKIADIRKGVLELILMDHPDDCFHCVRNGNCELQALAKQLGVKDDGYGKVYQTKSHDETSPAIVREPEKCILCGRCINVCGQDIQTVYALGKTERGFDTEVKPPSGEMKESVCINCGQCIAFCPTGALHERIEKDVVWEALEDPEKVVIVQEAPAVRVSLAEEFEVPIGTNMAGKMHSVLKMMGFDHVFDTNFSADLTIMEEGSELLDRLNKGGNLPMVTSCSPGWIKFIETFYPELIPHISSCKSPQQMFGAMSKTYFAEQYDIDPAKIVTVSIMPCTAKKFEARRPEMNSSGFQDVDYVLTTREFIEMIQECGIDLRALDDTPAEDLMGQYSGAGTIFGSSGGVMEAALRTAYELATGEALPNLDIEAARGHQGVKQFSVDVKDVTLNLAVANGLGNARKVLDQVVEAKRKGEDMPFHFIEIMACPGGCVGGGGQPHGTLDGSVLKRRAERATGLYAEDKAMEIRKSHENPAIKKIYADFLEKPLSHKSHTLLHTTYNERDAFVM